jgi:hypothetical protein
MEIHVLAGVRDAERVAEGLLGEVRKGTGIGELCFSKKKHKNRAVDGPWNEPGFEYQVAP